MRILYSMNLNLRMTVERSKRRSYFLSLAFITKCFSKNLLLRILKPIMLCILKLKIMNNFQLQEQHVCDRCLSADKK